MRISENSFLILLTVFLIGASNPKNSVPRVATMDEVGAFVLCTQGEVSRNLRTIEIQRGYRRKRSWLLVHTFRDRWPIDTKGPLWRVEKIPTLRILLTGPNLHKKKIYDLSRIPKMEMIATAYWIGDPKVPGTTTFSGHQVRRGIVAVDPNVIPLGMRLYIPGYGYAYSSDTGSSIKGNRIDLFVESESDSKPWGHKKVDVYLLEKSSSW